MRNAGHNCRPHVSSGWSDKSTSTRRVDLVFVAGLRSSSLRTMGQRAYPRRTNFSGRFIAFLTCVIAHWDCISYACIIDYLLERMSNMCDCVESMEMID